jgi:hypothetical protein
VGRPASIQSERLTAAQSEELRDAQTKPETYNRSPVNLAQVSGCKLTTVHSKQSHLTGVRCMAPPCREEDEWQEQERQTMRQ